MKGGCRRCRAWEGRGDKDLHQVSRPGSQGRGVISTLEASRTKVMMILPGQRWIKNGRVQGWTPSWRWSGVGFPNHSRDWRLLEGVDQGPRDMEAGTLLLLETRFGDGCILNKKAPACLLQSSESAGVRCALPAADERGPLWGNWVTAAEGWVAGSLGPNSRFSVGLLSTNRPHRTTMPSRRDTSERQRPREALRELGDRCLQRRERTPHPWDKNAHNGPSWRLRKCALK